MAPIAALVGARRSHAANNGSSGSWLTPFRPQAIDQNSQGIAANLAKQARSTRPRLTPLRCHLSALRSGETGPLGPAFGGHRPTPNAGIIPV